MPVFLRLLHVFKLHRPCLITQVEVRREDGAVRRRYRAKGLTDRGPRDLVFFNGQEQKDMTVLEYFEQQYHIRQASII